MSVRFIRNGSGATLDHNDLKNRGERTHAEIDSYLTEMDSARRLFVSLGARLAFLGTKTIVFVLTDLVAGAQPVEICFPYDGSVIAVSASCSTPSSLGSTNIQIERCSGRLYNSSPAWEPILSSGLFIKPNDRQHDTVDFPPEVDTLKDDVVNGDYFRVNIGTAGSGISGVVVEVQIQI